ncbi:swi5-dependent recombination DNA repair protein 1 homolog [Oscarella lobularis]|uniref:swi5-dependent recombination DNA repair protein 1 homolog n=1 Tax=Oscarella lobularis TaxID=121494 RepID=UPI0033142334
MTSYASPLAAHVMNEKKFCVRGKTYVVTWRRAEENEAKRAKMSSEGETMAEKRDLEKKIKAHEEKLRKLKLTKLYRQKHDFDEMEDLITKWREASQNAATELYQHFKSINSEITLGNLLKNYHIDFETIGYSEEDEEFV